MKTFNHTRPIRNAAGEEIGRAPAPARRVTVAELGGSFGPDKRRRLVVMLTAGDLIVFRPERTRQAVALTAADAYRYAVEIKVRAAAAERRARSKARR